MLENKIKVTANEIYDQAIKCGFDKCGIIPINEADGFDELYKKRVKAVPLSHFFYSALKGLRETKSRFPWAKSIVILSYNYGKHCFPEELQGKYAKGFLLRPVGDGKQGYDLPCLEQWFADHEIRAEGGKQFKDLSIGPLRYFAVKAGLGIIRKNNFFYTETGSYNILVGYVIDKELELTAKNDLQQCSEKCDLCRRACKTKALKAANTLNPFHCVSFCTTFGNCKVPMGVRPEKFEEWVCGCDNCQDACPYNSRHDWKAGTEFSNLKEIAPMIAPDNYDNLSDEFLIEQLIPKTAAHLQPTDVKALRKNAARALEYQRMLKNKE